MKIVPIVVILSFFIAYEACAQQVLQDQISAVEQVQEENDAANRAAEQQRQAEAENIRRQREAKAEEEKKREQSYEDKLRDLDIQQKALQIEAEKARVARSNDYIDQELKEKAARTDVIKSQADSERNISEGTKTLLEKTGDAEVKKESGIFSR